MFDEKEKDLNQADNQEQPIAAENEGLGEIRI